MKPALYSLLCLVLLTGCRHIREERCLADTRINGRPARFAFDTGAGATFVLSSRAKRLGLKEATPPPAAKPEPGKVGLGRTDLCRFEVGREGYTLKLPTLHLPWPWGWLLDIDGAIGWPDVKDNFIEIDAARDAILCVDGLPAETNAWFTLPVNRRTGVLALEIPRADGKTGVVQVDTGNADGISLAPDRWKAWRATRPHAHRKWSFLFMPGSGTGLRPSYRVDEFSLGPLKWKHVEVRKATRTEMGMAGKGDVFEGSLGLAALRQFNLVIDQHNNIAYLRPRADLAAAKQAPARAVALLSTSRTNSTVHFRFKEHQCADLAVAAFDSGRLEAGLSNVVQLLQLEPDNAWALALRGEATFALHGSEGGTNTLEQALGDLNRALELDPENVGAYFGRANIRYALRRWDDAVKDYRHFCEKAADAANYARLYVWLIRARTGDKAAADEELCTALGSGKRRQRDWQNQIGLFLLGKVSEADFLRPATPGASGDAGQCCEAWFYAGMKRQISGDSATAQDYLQKCMATGKKECDAYNFAAAELRMLHTEKRAQN